MHLFNIIEILNRFKIFQDHRIRKFSNNIDLRKLDFLSAEKSKRSCFVLNHVGFKLIIDLLLRSFWLTAV